MKARLSLDEASMRSFLRTHVYAAPIFLAALIACDAPSGDEPSDDDDQGMQESALAAPGGYKPPADVIAEGQKQYVAYDDAPDWNGGKSCGGTFLAGTKQLGDFLKQQFKGAVTSYGGYACRQNTANSKKTSVHGTGRAIDVFIPLVGGQADNDKGDPVANWLIKNAQQIGVQYIIWDRTQWSAAKSGTKVSGYGGPHPHHDHLHVELSVEGAAKQTPWFKGGATPNPNPNPNPTPNPNPNPNPEPPAPAAGSCESTTLGRAVPENACVQRPADKLWFRCVDGAWAESEGPGDAACTERHAL